MNYAIISLGGKQYRVREGERLLVDRLPTEEGKTFEPAILMVGSNGDVDFESKGVVVKARVVGHVLGQKVRIGKYRPKTGYRRHMGYRSRLSQIEIESIGKKAAAAKPRTQAQPKAEEKPKAEAKAPARPEAETKPKAPSKPRAAARPKAASEGKATARRAARKKES